MTSTSVLVLVVALITLIINVAAVVVMNTLKTTSTNQATRSSNDNEYVCFDCEKLKRFGKFELNPKWIRKENGQCCSTKDEAIKAVFNLKSSQTSSKESDELPTHNIADFIFSPVSAHKRLRSSVGYETTDDLVPGFEGGYISLHLDVSWSIPTIEHVRGIDVLKEGFRVKKSGWYFVYNNIRYNPDSSRPCGDYANQTWDHNVLRSRANQVEDSKPILTTVHTCCDTCSREKASAHTGGVFYLEAGDYLSAEVSGYALVRFDETASFFGLYMLGGDTQ